MTGESTFSQDFGERRRSSARLARSLAVALALATALLPTSGGLAQTCTDCVVYAVTELNLRQDPSLEAAVLRFVPAGAAVYRASGADVGGYAPVSYDSVPGWVVALGLVATPEEVDPTPAPAAPSEDVRVTLAPLVLRSGPAVDDPAILVMPEGALVTLTRAGAENGYVTIDYDGTTGWAYADLLARPDERAAA